MKVLAGAGAAVLLVVATVGGALVGGPLSASSGAGPVALGGPSRLAWATTFGGDIGASDEGAVRFIVAWETMEGASPRQNNPLNSTLDEPGAAVLAGNPAGVKVYPSLAVGLDADVATIEGNPAYQGIIAALDQGDLPAAAASLDASPWCGGCPGYGSAILAMAQAYANPARLAAAGAVAAGTGAITVAAARGSSTVGAAVVAAAQSQLGVPYVYGGESSGRAFDCSGLAQWVLGQVGVALPRVAGAQFDAGPAVSDPSLLAPGDLVFFGAGPSSIDHVGIYIGDGQMIDAPHTGAVVRIDPIFGFSPGYVGGTDPAGAGATTT